MSLALDSTPARFLLIAEGTGFLGRTPGKFEAAGFRSHFAQRVDRPGLDAVEEEDWRRGHQLARQVTFAQGALASFTDSDETENPYPQFSAAWETWADGYNAEAFKALETD